MHLKQLNGILNKSISPIYLLSGNVPLLIQEARDAIRAAAKKAGFTEHELLTVEPGFDWNSLINTTRNLSLFSEKRIIDLRNPNTKFDEHGTKALLYYLKAPSEDTVLIISTGKLTSAQQKTRWYKAIAKTGITIPIWPINAKDLPQWIQARLQQAQLHANHESIHYIAEFSEGNLLAVEQAIEKLKLLYPDGTITIKEAVSVINDNARFTIFDLVNDALVGKYTRAVRILAHLKNEGTEPILILWALAREIRSLTIMAEKIARGTSLTQVISSQWQSRKPLIKAALSRLTDAEFAMLLQQCAHADRMLKGAAVGNIWDELLKISLSLAKVNLLDMRKAHA